MQLKISLIRKRSMTAFRTSISLLLIFAMVLSTACSAKRLVQPIEGNAASTVSGIKALIGIETDAFLLSDAELFIPGNSACDWIAFAFALSGALDDYSAYAKGLENYVTECLKKDGSLGEARATEYHRIALTARALGCDPRAFGRMPDGSSADLIALGTYAYSGDLGEQGLNGYIFALLTLDCDNYAVPNNARYTRERIIDYILSSEETDGGFGLEKGNFDVDITAMALQALAPYKDERRVSEAIERAVNRLASAMTASCAFVSSGSENLESTAQVIIALCSLGIDPETDALFTRNGMNPVKAMELFRLPNGGFSHKFNSDGSVISCEQALRAYIALYKLKNNLGGLYNLSGISL